LLAKAKARSPGRNGDRASFLLLISEILMMPAMLAALMTIIVSARLMHTAILAHIMVHRIIHAVPICFCSAARIHARTCGIEPTETWQGSGLSSGS
jgi:hypothetical protein